MNRLLSACRVPACALLALCLPPAPSSGQAPAPGPVEALVYSTVPSTAAHRPEMALDGDSHTYFRSAAGMGDGDEFLLLLSRAIPVRSLQVTTGDDDGLDLLTAGIVETSPDAVHFTRAASFNAAGVASAAGPRLVRALRLRVNRGQGVPNLLVREITLDSPVKIARVLLGPGRGFVDISQAPDLAAWSQTAEKQMEESWGDTAAPR